MIADVTTAGATLRTHRLGITLQDMGFRFVRRGRDFKWVHPLLVEDGDLDCTNMGDVEFEAAVAEVSK